MGNRDGRERMKREGREEGGRLFGRVEREGIRRTRGATVVRKGTHVSTPPPEEQRSVLRRVLSGVRWDVCYEWSTGTLGHNSRSGWREGCARGI